MTAAQPDVKLKRQTRLSWIWLVPLIAALIGLTLVVKAWMHAGPVVTVSFESAEGLEVGQTKVRYKDVVIGLVKAIDVSPDHTRVLVQAELNRDAAANITREGTRFWVVRPRLQMTGVSGLGTLLSGAYIAVDTATGGEVSEGSVYEFTGLEEPPEISSTRPGSRFILNAPDLGSLDVGSPVYYRRIQVGRVIGYKLNPEGSSVDIQIFVDAPNDAFVTADSRFWNASGITFNLNANGVSMQSGSLASVIAGGVEFASADPHNSTPAPAGAVFELADTRIAAMAEPDGPPIPIELHYQQSVRGLKLGAPVDFRGLELGKVIDIDLEFNPQAKRFFVLVKAELYPMRFGSVYENMIKAHPDIAHPGAALLGPMVKHGLRAQVRAANLLTGQQYIALDFFSDAEPVEFDDERKPVLLPTVTGSFDRLQQQISTIVSKLEAVPFDGISHDLRASLKSVTRLVDRLQVEVAPQASATFKAAQRSLRQVDQLLAQDSPMVDNVERALGELGSAARSLRALSDYLQANPSALLRGRPADVLPVVSP